MRLNKYLALCGVGSRRRCDDIISAGRVSINGEQIQTLGVQVEEGDVVEVDGRPVIAPTSYSCYVFNKPPGCLCSKGDPDGRQTIYDLLPEDLQSVNYVGRLDLQSRGLVILTDDGDLLHRLTHPSYEIPRKYAVWLDKEFDVTSIKRVERGLVLLDGEELLPAKVKTKGKMIELTLREGKNREIRRMMETLGFEVRDLKRVEFAGVSLGGVSKGEYRKLEEDELLGLYNSVGMA